MANCTVIIQGHTLTKQYVLCIVLVVLSHKSKRERERERERESQNVKNEDLLSRWLYYLLAGNSHCKCLLFFHIR